MGRILRRPLSFYSVRTLEYARKFDGTIVFSAYTDDEGVLRTEHGEAPEGTRPRLVVYSINGGPLPIESVAGDERFRMSGAHGLLALAIVTVLTAGLTAPAAAAEVDPSMPFDHIVVIVEQDHTYDSYFGSYVPPAGRDGRPSTNEGLHSLADNYVLFDSDFCSSPGGTLGNMLDLTTGATHGLLFSSKESLTALADLDVPTVFDRLNERSIEWRLYDGGLSEVDVVKVTSGAYRVVGQPCPPRSTARRSGQWSARGAIQTSRCVSSTSSSSSTMRRRGLCRRSASYSQPLPIGRASVVLMVRSGC